MAPKHLGIDVADGTGEAGQAKAGAVGLGGDIDQGPGTRDSGNSRGVDGETAIKRGGSRTRDLVCSGIRDDESQSTGGGAEDQRAATVDGGGAAVSVGAGEGYGAATGHLHSAGAGDDAREGLRR